MPAEVDKQQQFLIYQKKKQSATLLDFTGSVGIQEVEKPAKPSQPVSDLRGLPMYQSVRNMQKLNSEVVDQAITFEKSCAKLKKHQSSQSKCGLSSSDDDEEDQHSKAIAKIKKP